MEVETAVPVQDVGGAAAATPKEALAVKQAGPTHVDVNKIAVDASEFPHLLKQYYERLFPYSRFYRWLSYQGDTKLFQNREFSFTLKDDVYIRYRSYQNEAEMTADIKKMNPYKIDIGAVFTDKPKDHKKLKASEFKPLERELVFDIDMTDYDEIRTCCSGAAICKKCWFFMNTAVKVVDIALREDFGFQNLLWVYSGRRGVHCWTCDRRANKLTNEGRTAVAEYLNIIAGGDQARKVGLRSPVYPAIERALKMCTGYFDKHVIASAEEGGQDILMNRADQEKLLSVIGDAKFEAMMLESWNGDGATSRERWTELCKELSAENKRQSKGGRPGPFTHRKNEIILQYTYPRIDVAVSTHMNHLLKSPLVVHPKTGRVCVPIDHEDIENFDPFTVPTITDLLRELDEYDGSHVEEELGGRVVKNYQKTSLLASIEVFDRFLVGCADEARAEKAVAKDVEMASAADTGNW